LFEGKRGGHELAMSTGDGEMNYIDRLRHFVSRATQGYFRTNQLVNLSRSLVMPKTDVVSWQPTHLSIFVTSKCSYHCDMCPTHSKKIPKSYKHRHLDEPDMSLDLFRFILDRYPEVLRAELIGVGEPLFNPRLFEMIKECEKRKVTVGTCSNGYALDAHIPDILHSGLYRLCVSVNGHTAKEFHRMTGNPELEYSKILRNVEALARGRGKKRSPRIDLNFIIDNYNYRHMGEMIEIGENLGADIVSLNQFLPAPFSGFRPEERCLYADDPDVREELKRLMQKKFRCDVNLPYLLRRPGEARKICRWPFSLVQVDGGGNIGGCHIMMLNMHENGNVYDKDAWNNQYFRDLRRSHLQGNLFWPCESCVESFGVNPSRMV
jgi:MoaA/NifB/PqqE/SkfB family radical SAM enzyme